MNEKLLTALAMAAIIATGATLMSSGMTVDAAQEADTKVPKKSAPQYSETCAHGHNGFNCKPSTYRVDITELQNEVKELKVRIADLEKRR